MSLRQLFGSSHENGAGPAHGGHHHLHYLGPAYHWSPPDVPHSHGSNTTITMMEHENLSKSPNINNESSPDFHIASPSARKRCISMNNEAINRTLLSHWSLTRTTPLPPIKCTSPLASSLCTPEDSPKPSAPESLLTSYFRRSSLKSPIMGISSSGSCEESSIEPLRTLSINIPRVLTARIGAASGFLKTATISQKSQVLEGRSKHATRGILQTKTVSRYIKPSILRSPLKATIQRKTIAHPTCEVSMFRRFASSLDYYVTSPTFEQQQHPSVMFGLPILDITSKEAIPRISPETLMNVLRGEYAMTYSAVHVIDARFSYEYHGGHVKGAFSCSSPKVLEAMFFNDEILAQQREQDDAIPKRTAIIFHCEFSSHRAPSLALFMRKRDRALNTYPKLFYPELYILHGGYREFFRLHVEYCYPQLYCQMRDPAFKEELRMEMQHFREFTARQSNRYRRFTFDQSMTDESASDDDNDDSHFSMLSLDNV